MPMDPLPSFISITLMYPFHKYNFNLSNPIYISSANLKIVKQSVSTRIFRLPKYEVGRAFGSGH